MSSLSISEKRDTLGYCIASLLIYGNNLATLSKTLLGKHLYGIYNTHKNVF